MDKKLHFVSLDDFKALVKGKFPSPVYVGDEVTGFEWKPVENMVGEISTQQEAIPCVYVEVAVLEKGVPISYYSSTTRYSTSVEIGWTHGGKKYICSFQDGHLDKPITNVAKLPSPSNTLELAIDDGAQMIK